MNLGCRAIQRNPLSSPVHGDVSTARVRLRKGRSILDPLGRYTHTYPSCSATKNLWVPSSAWIMATGFRSPLATSWRHNSRQPSGSSRTTPRLAFSSRGRSEDAVGVKTVWSANQQRESKNEYISWSHTSGVVLWVLKIVYILVNPTPQYQTRNKNSLCLSFLSTAPFVLIMCHGMCRKFFFIKTLNWNR